MSDTNPTTAFQNAAESQQNWAIRYGAEPTDGHIADRAFGLPELDKTLNDIFHGGIMAAGNHLYLEVGQVDQQGNFNTLRRIHGFSVKDTDEGTKLATEADGKMFTMVIGSENTPFSEDPIYQMDPHADLPNQLQSATDAFIFGEDATQIVFQGTEREVMTLYAGVLETTIALNNQNMAYNALQFSAPNGNSTHDVLREKLSNMAENMNLGKIGTHDASGIDFFPWYEKLDLPETSGRSVSQCAPLGDVRDHVAALEETAGEQWNAIKELGQKATLDQNIPIPAEPPHGAPGC